MKDNSSFSEHTCQTNHTIAWDNTKIITTNRRYHQRRCLEAWHINSAQAPLNHRNVESSIVTSLGYVHKFLQTKVALYYVWSFTGLPRTCILPIYKYVFLFLSQKIPSENIVRASKFFWIGEKVAKRIVTIRHNNCLSEIYLRGWLHADFLHPRLPIKSL